MTGCWTGMAGRLTGWCIRGVCAGGIGQRRGRGWQRGQQQVGQQVPSTLLPPPPSPRLLPTDLYLLLWLLIFIFLYFSPPDCLGQAANATAISGGPILTPFGTPATNAPIRVCLYPALGSPCSTAGVTLYSDGNLTQPLPNPTNLNSQGVYALFTTNGNYIIQIQTTPLPALPVTIFHFAPSAGGGGSGTVNPGQAAFAVYPTTLGSIVNPSSSFTYDIATGTVLTGPKITASVNKVINVTAPPYNALADCSTDNQTAITNAMNDALTQNASVYFPATGSGCFLTSTITWKGQSFFGAGVLLTTIKGMPGVDVFQTPDSAVALQSGANVHDLKIIVDTSVNASATVNGGNNTYPNRIGGTVQGTTAFTVPIAPGPLAIGYGTCTGHGFTASLSTPTTVTMACGLTNNLAAINASRVIGAPITITGAGPGGATYTGTILAVGSFTGGNTQTVTVSPVISTAVTGTTGTVLNAITPPWYFGNAGIALQCSNGNSCSGNLLNATFTNIQFVASSGLQYNFSTGIFTQIAMYNATFSNIDNVSLWAGYIEAAPPSGRVLTGDTSTFNNFNVHYAAIPFVALNGNDRVVNGLYIYASAGVQSMGPYLLTTGQTTSTSLSWTINTLYSEGAATLSGETARFMGGPHSINAANFLQGSVQGYTEWLAYGSQWNGIFGGNIHIGVGAGGNYFQGTGMVPTNITDSSNDNRFENPTILGTNSYMRRRFNPSPQPFRDTVGKLDGSFLATGNSAAPYLNISDLLTTCADWAFANAPTQQATYGSCVNDPTGTEISNSYFQSAAATTTFNLVGNAVGGAASNAWSGQARLFGINLPETKVNVYVQAECVGASSCTATGRVKDGTGAQLGFGTGLTFGSTWTTQSFTADLTSAVVGDYLNFYLDTWVNTGTNYRVAWYAIQPVNNDEHTWLYTNGLPVSSSVNLKVVDTTGAGITTGPTSSTSGDIATFNGTSGKIQDSGTALAGLAPLASPTFTGNPVAPTQATSDNSTKLATTAYVHNVVLVGSLTTTSATSDTVTVTGMSASGHCMLTATNASAATNIATTYVSAKTTNQITVTHVATASMTYDVLCGPY